jgi:hypothetical protein
MFSPFWYVLGTKKIWQPCSVCHGVVKQLDSLKFYEMNLPNESLRVRGKAFILTQNKQKK